MPSCIVIPAACYFRLKCNANHWTCERGNEAAFVDIITSVENAM